jgi:uncharacterized sulfatase
MISNKIKGKIFIISLLFIAIGQALVHTATAQSLDKKYNVLFIAVDDLNDVGIYDNPEVKTPNMERLFKKGIRFNRAYCQYPLCNPSRASIMNGLRPDQTKVYNNTTNFRNTIPNTVTLPQLFKQNGYFSARIGKIYHYNVPNQIGTDGMDDPMSWDKVVNPKGRDVLEKDKIINPVPSRAIGASPSYYSSEGTDAEMTDGKIADGAVQLLQENKDKPFFLAVGFFLPHHPFVTPKKYFDMYPLDKITLPKPKPSMDDLPEAAITTQPINFGLSEQQRKESIRAYYASVTFMDAQLGRLLDGLEQLKLADNTIIVFWSDHGASFSEHGQWLKSSLFEITNRTPMIISVPDGLKGRASDRLVELVDLYPTVADLCGLTVPVSQGLSGKSLRPLLVNPDAKWTEAAYSQVKRNNIMGRSVRTKKWRFTEWDEGKAGMELYNEKNDKGELVNLASKKKYSGMIKELSVLLRKSYSSDSGN